MKQSIINAAKVIFGANEKDVFYPTRKRFSVKIRHMSFYYLRTELNWTFERIGILFKLSHATVLSGVKDFKNKLDVYKEERTDYERFKKLMNNYRPLEITIIEDFLERNGEFLSDDVKMFLEERIAV